MDQYIDVTGIPNGRYRVVSEVNPDLGFRQTSTVNDATWVDVRLKGKGLSIVGYGPSA